MRTATVRFYFDEDVLGLAKILVRLRSDVTYPGDPGGVVKRQARPPCLITPGAKDSEWIPQVASAGWVAITRDSAIQRHTALTAAVRASAIVMVALSGPEAKDNWTQLELLMTRWREIERLSGTPGPAIYTATRTGALRAFPL